MGVFDVADLGRRICFLPSAFDSILRSTIAAITMLNTGKLAGKTVYITGASRGIGEKIGLKCAKDGANVVIAAKTAEPHPKLPGTIYTAAQASRETGQWYLDLKNGAGSCGQGVPPSSP